MAWQDRSGGGSGAKSARTAFASRVEWFRSQMGSKAPSPGPDSPTKEWGRPSSQASTRCPSSASTMKRPASRSSACPSPLADSGGFLFGGKKKTQVQTVSEAWANLGPTNLPRGGSPEGLGSPLDPPSDEEIEVPDIYRLNEVESTAGKPLKPNHALWVSLKGGNGNWQKRKAVNEWRWMLAEHGESETERISEVKWARQAKKEAEEKRRRDRQELQKRVEEDALERKRRAILEAELLIKQQEEEKVRQATLADKLERMHKPRPCKVCTGSGKCIPCQGKGCKLTLYLSPVVNERTKPICGQLPRGCAACGGSGDGAWWGEFICGSGACQSCGGQADVPAPPNGWLDCQ